MVVIHNFPVPLFSGPDMADATCFRETSKMISDASSSDSYVVCQGFSGEFRILAQ